MRKAFVFVMLLSGCISNQDYRIPLDSIKESSAAAITIKTGCYWDYPGRKPWTGDSAKLLTALGLTQDQSKALLTRIATNQYDSVIEISALKIEERRYPYRVFSLNMDMSSGENILCLDTIPGRNWEIAAYPAKLYIVDSMIYIAIPEICGNVTRLTLQGFLYRRSDRGYNFHRQDSIRSVDTPGTLFLMLLGLLALCKFNTRMF